MHSISQQQQSYICASHVFQSGFGGNGSSRLISSLYPVSPRAFITAGNFKLPHDGG